MPETPGPDRKKIRLGLALITAIFLGCIVGFALVDDPLGKAVFFGVALVALVRVGLLSRNLKRNAKQSPAA